MGRDLERDGERYGERWVEICRDLEMGRDEEID